MKLRKSSAYEEMSNTDLQKAHEELGQLLATLEEEHRKAAISDQSYAEIKGKNNRKLEEVTRLLTDRGLPPTAAAPAAPAGVSPELQAIAAKVATQTLVPAKPPVAASQPAQQTFNQAPPDAPAPLPIPVSYPAPAGSADVERLEAKLEGKLTTEVEKLRAALDAMKEGHNASEERSQRISESLGELRSMVFAHDATAKTIEAEFAKLKEAVNTVNPTRVEKEFAKRDKAESELSARTEALETKLGDLGKTTHDVQKLLAAVGGLENVARIDRMAAEKIEQMNQKAKRIDQLADRVEKMFVDLHQRLEEFDLFKERQQALDELSKDLIKNLDNLTVQQAGLVTRGDLDQLRGDITAISGNMVELRKTIDIILPVVQLKLPDSIQRLQDEKTALEGLLKQLEEGRQSNTLSVKEYLHSKERNEQRLAKIERQLRKEWDSLDLERKQAVASEGIQPGAPIPTTTGAIPALPQPAAPEPTEEPESKKGKPKPEPKKAAPEPEPKKATPEPEPKKSKPAPEPEKPPKAEKPAPPSAEDAKPATKVLTKTTAQLLTDLDAARSKGLISDESYERTRALLERRAKGDR